MAHNIHFIAISADSHEEAEINAMSQIENWGNENNWRYCIGSVNRSNDIHQSSESDRFDMVNLNEIKKILNEVILSEPYTISSDMKGEFLLYAKYINAKHAYKTHLKHPLNIWEDEIYAWEFENVGLTNMSYGDNKSNYIVAIDMHS